VTGAASAPQVTAERELVDALRRGEEDAFRSLVLTHDRGLRRMARLYVGEAFVDDVVQETWIVVVRGIGSFEGRSALRTWIFGILVNIARRQAARDGRTIPFSAVASASERYQGAVDPDRLQHPELGRGYWPAPPSWPRDPESSALAAEARKVVSRAIGALQPAQREVITLRDVEGWPAAEVSALLGISDVNQRTLLHRARVAVRRALEVYLSD
jgi:RNA polymerase sigma-70 factor (ECF subfamily)